MGTGGVHVRTACLTVHRLDASPEGSDRIMPPDLVAGRYRILRAVGRGGMGAVWLCRDEVLHREVAIKQIERLEEETAAKAARPLREARLAAALNHENAVSVFDIVEDQGSTWLVMEYVPSRTLSEILRSEGRLPVDRVVRIGAQLASALATAHALGIIHRDIKPGNVLIGDNDLAKISDFGIARGHHDEQLTMTGFVTGTPAYFSPELARGGDPSQASDVWALGATLYAAVEGEPPYGKGPNPLALLTRIASQPPPRPAHAGHLTSTLASMLKPKAEARASMEAVAGSLQRLAAPADLDAARIREKARGYADTTLHDRPVGVLKGEPRSAPAPSRSQRPNVVAPMRPPPPVRPQRASVEGPPAVGAPHDPAGGTARGRPSFPLLIVGLATILVLLITGVLLRVALRSPTDDANTSPPTGDRQQTAGTNGVHSSQASTHSASTRSNPIQSQEPASHSTPQSTGSGPATPGGGQQSPPPASAARPAAFVSRYFTLVPNDLDRGWRELAPSMRAMGRDAYERFWGSIDSVDLADVHAVSPDAVDYQITYHFSDGRVVREQQRIDLAPHGGSFRITDDTVLSSVTVHS
jgi:serine/threonine protein kinase